MCRLSNFVEPSEADPSDLRVEAVKAALGETLQDGELFVVYRAGASVGANRMDQPWMPYDRGLSATNPDLYGRLAQIQSVVERGYGWGPTLGIWAGVLATLVLIQTGWLAHVIGAAAALGALKSGWFYLAITVFGGIVHGTVNEQFQRRVLRQQVPRLRALATLHGLTEAELYTRVQDSGLWSLQQQISDSPRAWTFAEE